MATNRVDSRKELSELETLCEAVREATAKLQEYTKNMQSSVSNLENSSANVSNDVDEEEQIKVKLTTTAVNDKVILDVGGKKYTTSVNTLTREKGTFFTVMFSDQSQLERDPKDDSIFIDRDGELFSHILAYLRTDLVPNDIMKDENMRQKLIVEAEYFHLHKLIEILKAPDQLSASFLNGGTLLSNEQKKILFEFCEKNHKNSKLLYKASRDGFDENSFHRRCINQAPTIIIIQSSNGCLFGGYARVPWTFNMTCMANDNAFLFTLRNPHNIPPTKYPLQLSNKQYAVSHASDDGTTSGDSRSLHICSNSHSTNGSFINWPSSYTDSIGQGHNTPIDSRNFLTIDIEVFKLI